MKIISLFAQFTIINHKKNINMSNKSKQHNF